MQKICAQLEFLQTVCMRYSLDCIVEVYCIVNYKYRMYYIISCRKEVRIHCDKNGGGSGDFHEYSSIMNTAKYSYLLIHCYMRFNVISNIIMLRFGIFRLCQLSNSSLICNRSFCLLSIQNTTTLLILPIAPGFCMCCGSDAVADDVRLI